MDKKYCLLTFLLLTSSTAHILSGPVRTKSSNRKQLLNKPIRARSSDGKKFEIKENILRISKTLKTTLKDCVNSSEDLPLGKSSEDFKLILPFLKSIDDSRDNIQELLSEKKSSEIARIIEIASFFYVPQIIDHGGNVLKERLDTICKQRQEDSEDTIKSFLESMETLTYYMNKEVAGKVIKNHPAAAWVFDRCAISRNILQHETEIYSLTFSPDGNYLAIGSNDNTAKILDIKTGEAIHTLDEHESAIYSLSFSPDGNYLATGFEDNTAIIWNTKTGEYIHALGGHTSPVDSLSFSPDGNYLATGSEDNTAIIWNTKTGKATPILREYGKSAVFSQDGNYLAAIAENNNTAKILNIKTGKSIHTLEGHESAIYSLSFSPDGNYLATGSEDNTAIIWNTKTGKAIHTLKGHTDFVTSVVFSPDGNHLATASMDTTVKIWNVKMVGALVAYTLEGNGSAIGSLSFSPDGNHLITGSWNSATRIWNIGCLNKLEQSLYNIITLKQAAMLILFYENRNNETFACPEYFLKDFESLPENIKKAIPENIKNSIDRLNWVQQCCNSLEWPRLDSTEKMMDY